VTVAYAYSGQLQVGFTKAQLLESYAHLSVVEFSHVITPVWFAVSSCWTHQERQHLSTARVQEH